MTKKFKLYKGFKEMIFNPCWRNNFNKKEIIALNNINMEIYQNDVVSILGPNGAGKTTLIRILATVILPTSGDVFVNNYSIRECEKVKKYIGYVVSDERSFFWRLTGRENLRFFCTLNKITKKEIEKKIDEVVKLVELDDYIDRMFKDYSTGMRQRLALARALILNPDIILIDEPTKNLDPVIAEKIRENIHKITKDSGKIVIFATHNLDEAIYLSNKIAILNKGKLCAFGTENEIKLQAKKNSFKEAYSYFINEDN